MSYLYDVYTHPEKGMWGVAVSGQVVHCAESKGGQAVFSTLAPYKLAGEITRRVRLGYQKSARARYFKRVTSQDGTVTGEFVDKHPELVTDEKIVLYTPKLVNENLQSRIELWDAMLDKTNISTQALEAWKERIESAQSYVVATASHPAVALLLADFARESGRQLLGDHAEIPMGTPRAMPLQWQEWLEPFFTKEQVRKAQDELGWSVREVLFSQDIAQAKSTNEDASWYAQASLNAF
jgi:hypothetical protein